MTHRSECTASFDKVRNDVPYKIDTRFMETVVDGEHILMDVDSGNFSVAKGVAGVVWEMIDGVGTLAEIRARLSEQYRVTSERCAADVDDFVSALVAAGFVAFR